VSEFDELVELDSVLMAGRLSPDGRVAQYKAESSFVANPGSAEIAHWFCSERLAALMPIRTSPATPTLSGSGGRKSVQRRPASALPRRIRDRHHPARP